MADQRIIDAREAYERAFALLGVEVVRWHNADCTLRRESDRWSVDVAIIAETLDRAPSAYTPENLALRIADVLGLHADEDRLAQDILHALPLMRPRILRSEMLEGPARAMCRRALSDRLIVGVSIGRRTERNFVTTRLLDAWGLSFDDVLDAATDELMRHFDPGQIRVSDHGVGTLELFDPFEPAIGAAFGLDRIVSGMDAWPGALLGMPCEDTLVLVPLDERSDLRALSSVIETTQAIADQRPEILADQPCWLIEGTIRALDVRLMLEGSVKRAVIQTDDPEVAHLLAFLSGEPPEEPLGFDPGNDPVE